MMAYLEQIVFLGLCSTTVALTGCDKGSLGQYETDGDSDTAGGSESASESATATSTSGGSATGTSGSTSGDPTSSTSGATDGTSTTGTTGGAACAPNESFTCEGSFDCGDQCGTPGPWDENGCLRPSCQAHAACNDDELCYRAIDFGGCEGSVFFCEDLDGECVCGGTDDCNGGFCIPAEQYPVGNTGIEDGPTASTRYENGCAPNDALTLDFYIGLPDSSCGGPTQGSVRFQLLEDDLGIHTWGDTLITGGYDRNDNGLIDPDEIATDGIVRLSSTGVGEERIGEYELVIDDVLVFGEFEAAPRCVVDIICG